MANTRELRRRIKSVKNTSQITHAMEMVAATKMRKAQNQALAGRPYAQTLHQALAKLASLDEKLIHPLMLENSGDKIGILLLSTDRSLCGALNTNLFRYIQNLRLIENLEVKMENIVFYTVGKKGRDFLAKTNKTLTADFENPEKVEAGFSGQLRRFLVEAYKKMEVSQVYVLFPNFISILRQEPKLVKLLPVSRALVKEQIEKEGSVELTPDNKRPEHDKPPGEISIFEPDPKALLDFIVLHHLDTQIYQAMLETKASEHSARMMAMKNATDNAKDLVSDLTLTYNGVRQDAITRELAEISTASMALE